MCDDTTAASDEDLLASHHAFQQLGQVRLRLMHPDHGLSHRLSLLAKERRFLEAAHVDGGRLLTRRDRLPEATESALTYRKPAEVVIMGGPGVVSDAVLGRIQRITGLQPQRLFGDDRYATAVRALQYTYAGGPLSAVTGEPLLLVRQQCVPAVAVTETSRLGVTAATALGSAGVVSNAAAHLHSCG